jgi:hypothetical protein
VDERKVEIKYKQDEVLKLIRGGEGQYIKKRFEEEG